MYTHNSVCARASSRLHPKTEDEASDERAMHELWIHFTGVLDRHLASTDHRSCLSEVESQELNRERNVIHSLLQIALERLKAPQGLDPFLQAEIP